MVVFQNPTKQYFLMVSMDLKQICNVLHFSESFARGEISIFGFPFTFIGRWCQFEKETRPGDIMIKNC